MGLTVCRATRQQLIEKLLGPSHHETVAHHIEGERLWCVKRYHPQGKEHLYIALFILESWPPNEYGYRDADESGHPYHYDCPLSFLDLVEPYEPGGKGREWRQFVREFHAGTPRAVLKERAFSRVLAEVANG